MEFRSHRLDNGLEIIAEENPDAHSMSVAFLVRTGARDESDEVAGVSHFLEHMCFKGTPRRSADDVNREFDEMGADYNAFTSEETTCFFSKAGHGHFDDLWDVLSDMFLNSTFDPQELEKERNVIREELAMYQDQPHHYVQELLNETLWPDQPLGRPLTGTTETLGSLTRSHLVGYMRQNGGRARIQTETQRVHHDLYYIENWSILLDLYIVFMTPFSLLSKNENAF